MKTLKQFAVAAFGLMLTGSAEAEPIIVGSYYEDNWAKSCPSSCSCVLQFPPVPGDQPILITNVSCYINVHAPAAQLEVVDLSPGTGTSHETLLITRAAATATKNTYAAGGEIRFYFAPGQAPRLRAWVTASSTISFRCRIVGIRPAPV